MTLRCRFVVAFLACHVAQVVGPVLAAQDVNASGRNRWALAVTLDAGRMPDDFGNQCGSGAMDVAGGGATLLFRPRPGLVAGVDTRMSGRFPPLGCKTILPGPTPIGPNEFENWAPKGYPNGVPSTPFLRNALHVGLETPNSPLLRATVGGGMIWSGRYLPFGTVAIGGSTPGRVRLHWGLETCMTRVRVREEHTRYFLDTATFTQTPLPSRVRSYVETLKWTALQLGVEVPVAGSY
jgi:hypothetical protein